MAAAGANQEAKTARRNSDIATGCVIYKTDQFLVDFGCEGTDAYAKNGNFIVEAVCPKCNTPADLISAG